MKEGEEEGDASMKGLVEGEEEGDASMMGLVEAAAVELCGGASLVAPSMFVSVRATLSLSASAAKACMR